MNVGFFVLLGVVAWAAIFGCLGRWIAGQCGRSEDEGMFLGGVFGPFGCVIESLLPHFPYDDDVRRAVCDAGIRRSRSTEDSP